MSVPELPLTISIFREGLEETARRCLVSLQVDLDFDPRGRNNRGIWSERIYAKVISPMKVDVMDRVRKTLDPLSSRFAVRKHEVPVNGHEERWAVSEMLAPSCRPLLADVMGHIENEAPHAVLDRVLLRRRQARTVDEIAVSTAP